MGHLKAQAAATNSFRLARNLHARLRQIDTFHNPDLTPDALIKARDAARNRVLTEGKNKAAALRKAAADGYTFAMSRVEQHRPRVNNDSVAELTRSAQAWELIVKPQLDAGKHMFEIIPNADWDTLLAISRFAEPTIKATEPANEVPTILSNIQSRLDDRAAQIHPDDTARTLLNEAKQAKEALNAVAIVQSAIDNSYTAQGVNNALIYATREVHHLGLLPAEPEWSPKAQDDAVAERQARNGNPVPDAYEMALSAPDFTIPAEAA